MPTKETSLKLFICMELTFVVAITITHMLCAECKSTFHNEMNITQITITCGECDATCTFPRSNLTAQIKPIHWTFHFKKDIDNYYEMNVFHEPLLCFVIII